MFRFAIVLMFVVLAAGSPRKQTKLKSISDRIVGGRPSFIEKRPYQVSMLTKDASGQTFLCGGSILSPRYILTAAHCVKDIVSVTVRAGSANLYSGGTTVQAKKLITIPQYNPSTYDYDVAIIDFEKNALTINNRTIRTIKLADASYTVPTGTQVTVAGWGQTSENGATSPTLLEVTVPIISHDVCKQSYTRLTERMICAGQKQGGKDSCGGDSGGPLVVESNNLQVGIVSYGVGCARPNYPGVYTNVPTVRSWIKSITNL